VLPVAHIGHYLWVLYLFPVAVVVAGIVKSTRAQRGDDDRG
jgi:hypothetical protein